MALDPEQLRAAEEQADILVQALPFLRRYAGVTIVVKYGGHAMGDEDLARKFGRDIALLKQGRRQPRRRARRPGRKSTLCCSVWPSRRASSTASA